MKIEPASKIKTYGKVKSHKPMAKVMLFFTAFLVLVAVLTIARGFIVQGDVAESVTGESVGVEQRAKVKIDNQGESKFQELSFVDLSQFESSGMVKDLPKKAIISLEVGGNYYTLSRSSIKQGKPSSPDVTISIPLSYLSQISSDLCDVMKQASQSGELVISTHLSETSLMWKYKSMLKYRECLQF